MMLPNGWKRVKLGDCFDVQLGKMLNKNAREQEPQYPYIANVNVRWGTLNIEQLPTMYFSEREKEKFALKKNDILMCEGGEIGRCTVLKESLDNVFYQKACHRLRAKNNLCSPDYLYFYINHYVTSHEIVGLVGESSIAHLPAEKVIQIQLNLPPIEEQKKIAATLSVWDSAIEKMEKLIEAKESQKNSLVWEIIENQNNHIKIGKVLFDKSKWKVCKLSDVTSGFDYGMNAAAKEYDGKNKYIRITDIDEISHKYNNDELVSPEGELDEKYLVKKGDILFARTGASTGKSYLYDDRDGVLYFAGFLIRAHVTNDNPFFVYIQTLTAKYRNWVKKMSARSGQPGINAEEYKELPIVIPPIHEQNVIVDLFSKVEMEISLLKQQLENYKKQKQGLMQKLLTGEWRVK